MVAIGSTNKAFFFDGVSDSIIIPQGAFSDLGHKKPEGGYDARTVLGSSPKGDKETSITFGNYNPFVTIEAWVMPDCGGTIIKKEGQFELSLGNVDTPGPAVFTVHLNDGNKTTIHTITTAFEETNGYDGTVYPTSEYQGIHDSYNRFNSSYDDATDLNKNHRSLLHVVATFRGTEMLLYINGQVVAKKNLGTGANRLQNSSSHVYIGGEGGQFRGVMEAIHVSAEFDSSFLLRTSPLPNNTSMLLYRFEEPITPIEDVYTFSDVSSTVISITATEAVTLAKKLTGLSTVSGTIDFTVSPYSSGKYEIIQPNSAGSISQSLPHVPYNLLINPNSINPNTKKPNSKPPERVRLESINTTNGQLTISSIHLDFDTHATGKRGLLNTTHTSNVENSFVIISADLLVDSATGKPYQPPHYSTQIIDRTGQMVIDEGGFDNHGFVFSSRMSITTVDTNNPFAATWPTSLDTRFSIGHSGRHIKNHVDGHHYLRMLPPATEEIISLSSDGTADIVELLYDESVKGTTGQLPVNSKLDIYRDIGNFNVKSVKNSSAVSTVYNDYQGVSITGTKKLLAIGGPLFDVKPFLLKGPSPVFGVQADAKLRTHHLRPSRESRVALLHLPILRSTYNIAPYIEIHYNAIDLTGASMSSSNTDTPLLMIEKTVPSTDLDLGTNNFIYDLIVTALSSNDLTLHAPGGLVTLESTEVGDFEDILAINKLVGDNSEGYDSDANLDESLTPVNYTPSAQADAIRNNTPQIVQDSVSQTSKHNSAFNKLVLNKINTSTTFVDKGDFSRIEPETIVDSPANGQFDTGIGPVISPIHEMFDVIDNIYSNENELQLIIQPSDRRRTNQLAHLQTLNDFVNTPNNASLFYMMSKTRIRSMTNNQDEAGGFDKITCYGVTESLTNATVDFKGKGSPDSHIVKEIEPNAPVVTVTLGGPGQGAMDTNATFEKSILAHKPYSTRRAYALKVATMSSTDLFGNANTVFLVNTINNQSSTWGTYGFPRYGRVYFASGASARYDSKTGVSFTFSQSTLGSGDFVTKDGVEYTTVAALLQKEGLFNGNVLGNNVSIVNFEIMSEGDFGEESLIDNGSTINDRMFQAMNDVSHDYQLGTQYASTRALVEIPFFANQMFTDDRNGVLVGPDNSFKVHLDATMTAHTWNPNPVGRRPKDVAPADREADSAYSFSIENNDYIPATITLNYTPSTYVAEGTLTVEDGSIFPIPSTTEDEYQGVDGVYRYRKAYLADGNWVYYSAVNGNVLTIPKFNKYSCSVDFNKVFQPGQSISANSPSPQNGLKRIASDEYTPSSDFEGRSEYYYDDANVKTQGGNVDYGLRQYVSAVEFKAGPESNPHTGVIEPKRASGVIQSVYEHYETAVVSGVNERGFSLSLSDEDLAKFPDLGIDAVHELGEEKGDMLYEAYIEGLGYCHYYGFISNAENDSTASSIDVDDKNIFVTTYNLDLLSPSAVGKKITLTRRCRRIFTKDTTLSTLAGKMTLQKEFALSTSSLTGAPVTVSKSSAALTVTYALDNTLHGTTHKHTEDTNAFGFNVKKGDKVWEYYDNGGSSEPKYTYLGVVANTGVFSSGNHTITFTANLPSINAGGKIVVQSPDYEDVDAILNTKWTNPFAAGGLRNGDTIWANMSYNNPHAVEGLFFKSRGVLNESQVWNGFNGGLGELDTTNPRDSIPLENFLIGESCLETAKNFVQHVNKTIEQNYISLGLTASQAPTVAYVDPYLASQGHARVLLYDVAHDREFIALQDIHMQVQSSAQTTHIGWNRYVVKGTDTTRTDISKEVASVNGGAPHAWTTQIDVANGFPSQNRYIRSKQQSKFIESAYAHDIANYQADHNTNTTRNNSGIVLHGKSHGHFVHNGYSINGAATGFAYGSGLTPRTQQSVVLPKVADSTHSFSRNGSNVSLFVKSLIKTRNAISGASFRDPSTFFDTPDGTRVIPAFLCLKGIRSSSLTLNDHEESRLQHLPQWKDMDFIRRLSVDVGEIGQTEGVVDVFSGVEEIVRKINQYGALNARLKNGSAHNPAVWWDTDKAFNTTDKGTHMGYLRAHLGREVQDENGNIGHTVVIHSTVPGATGRNFCIWLDNSTGQTQYQPTFIIGHGGRWRNFWALPEDMQGENMHPAPMPLNKHGRPFAPITTLQQYIHPSSTGEDVKSPNEFGTNEFGQLQAISASTGGKGHNTDSLESFDIQGSSSTIVKGLRVGTSATARVNFGGLVASGVPGWSPNAGKWGYGNNGDNDFDNRYGKSTMSSYSDYVPGSERVDVTSTMYGIQLEDNLGVKHGIRYIYKNMGDNFANENTSLPSTIENEICIYFNDKDVSQGGFTIGKHMSGGADATGVMDFTNAGDSRVDQTFRGNLWRGVNAPNHAVHCQLALSGTTITTTFHIEPLNNMTHDDKLGYLGFPKENGIVQISKAYGDSAKNGETFTYERREGLIFYGVAGVTSIVDSAGVGFLITPVLNWTSLVTDEVLAAATAAAINSTNVYTEEGQTFDCRDMYATDGKTLGEWGVAGDAIKIRAFNPDNKSTPVSSRFSASLFRDLGIQAAHLEFGEIDRALFTTGDDAGDGVWDFSYGNSRAYTDAQIDAGRQIDCGYIPYNILQINTISKGKHGNTATPVLVDSSNNVVNVATWRQNLQGSNFTRFPGDHILPMVDNPTLLTNTNWTGSTNTNFTGGPYVKGHAGVITMGDTTSVAVGDWLALKDEVFGRITAETSNTNITMAEGTLATMLVQPDFTRFKNTVNPFDTLGWNNVINTTNEMWNMFSPNGQGIPYAIEKVSSTPTNGSSINPQTKTNIATTTVSGTGSGLTVDILYAATSITSVAINTPGTGYNPGDIVRIVDSDTNAGTAPLLSNYTNLTIKIMGIPTIGESIRLHLNDETSIVATPKTHSTLFKKLLNVDNSTAINWPEFEPFTDVLLSKHMKPEFEGLRSLGSVFSEPIVYFKGGKNSIDHSVPVFFGGGFSGALIDVNDGTSNDYSSFYTHPYANGPTGVSGIQNANEILGSHAMLDCNAMFAFFPGTPMCNQHRATIISPFFNKNNMLSPDLDIGVTAYSSGVVKAKPVPLVLRFAHPTARYEDHRDGTENKTTYLIFGPGQAFPFTQEIADDAAADAVTHNVNEPFSGKIITSSNTWSRVPRFSSAARMCFPNHITNNAGEYLPDKSAYYHARTAFHWKVPVNWETPAGYTNIKYRQRPQHGRFFGQTITAETTYDSRIHPMNHNPTIGFGIAMAADMIYHMDGGFHAGGSWLDNQLTFNSVHPKKNTRIVGGNSSSTWTRDNQIHPTAFRVAGPLTGTIQDYVGSSTDFSIGNTKMEYIVVDATRCQNGEEMATVLGAAINAFPGAGALKAIGGTHMPSMGNAMRQDRYGWVDIGTVSSYTTAFNNNFRTANITNNDANYAFLESIPACGWIRTGINLNDSTTSEPRYAAYSNRSIIKSGSNIYMKFYLAPNRKTGATELEEAADGSADTTVNNTGFVWAKAGTIRFNNEDDSTRDHMTQAHFSGIVDAVDRTKPIGAIGWHGERYSYLNSLKITKTTSGTGYAAGLGAYHQMLNFSPYGSAGTVMNTYGHLSAINPMINSPESTDVIDGIDSLSNLNTYLTTPYTDYSMQTEGRAFTFRDTEDTNLTSGFNPINYTDITEDLTTHQGIFTSAFLVVTNESESALIAKFDRDGITAVGDWLHVKGESSNPITFAGTTLWDERIHGQDRFIAPANAGPNVEALIVSDMAMPVGTTTSANWADSLFPSNATKHLHSAISTDEDLENATPDRAKTGDLINDLSYSIGSMNLETDTDVERNVAADKYSGTAFTELSGYSNNFWMQDVNAYQMQSKTPAKNFSIENVVWKRMDGGSLSLPAINARGLGAVPFMTRVVSNTAYTTGEKIYGNVRFSFETTNSAMLPILQAQELSHPQLATTNPRIVNNVLNIPNEELQFESINVTDDAGQEHTIEGGSPLGTIIRGFRVPTNRGTTGLAPALANSGNVPNLKLRIPNPNHIPGNIVIRGGFDPIQGYQNETMGSGGMIHPDLGADDLGYLFDNSVSNPRAEPTYENHNWEHIDSLSLESTNDGWDNASLHSSYELHDRALYFHITKMSHSHTHRYPTVYTHASGIETDTVSVSSWNATTNALVIDATLNANVFNAGFGTKEIKDGRKFLRVYNPTTDEGVICSYIAQNSTTLTVVGDIDFETFMAEQTVTNLKIVPSYYMPAGSARLFAARRLRDHAEVSGNSPDMAHTQYTGDETIAYNRYSKPVLTPMPYPRMGHHYVNATLPMLPGHWAHPLYQSVYRKNTAQYAMSIKTQDSTLAQELIDAITDRPVVKSDLTITEKINPLESEINFSGINAAPSGPSDIHGGAFTLMFETGVKWDGYGVLATVGDAGQENKAGGHSIVLAAAANYTLANHFPDPAEVGAYQIVIQPNLHSGQIQGFNLNNSTNALTSQQVNTVIGLTHDESVVGGLVLTLARATQADVRGCEIFINEMMLDLNPDAGSQFTNIPPLLLYNAFGVNLHETPSFSRQGFPYSPMFSKATPGYTLNIPWWSVLFADVSSDVIQNISDRNGKNAQYSPHDYYQFSKSTYGSIGNQLTLQGYPSIYPDIYSKLLQNTSIIPKCTVVSFDASGGFINVDDGSLFPVKPKFGEKLSVIGKDGETYTTTYTKRDGHDADAINLPFRIEVSNSGDGATFYTKLYAGVIITLINSNSINILTNKKQSVFSHYVNDIIKGSSDTSSLYLPDAFLCMWHQNLGKPYTYFSDNTSRAWDGNAVDADMYNAIPEHFETIHYHAATYAMSNGPFAFKIKVPQSTGQKIGDITNANSNNDSGGASGSDFGSTMYNRLWPCGSRGGPQASSLEEYMLAVTSWDVPGDYDSMKKRWYDTDHDNDYAVSGGISTQDTGSLERRSYGYRIAVRQPLNKPRWGILGARAHYEGTASGSGVNTRDYDSGPLIQSELYSSSWLYRGGSGLSSATAPKTNVGIMERHTNFTGMLGIDKADNQVRYSQGRRMTRPFGVPIRTLRQPTPGSVSAAKTSRDWWGDGEGKGITDLSVAAQYYLVDWWGNERGEDVRRAPVRGFGMRPVWDCGDAYEYDRTNNRNPTARIWNNGKPIFNVKYVLDSDGQVALSSGHSIPRFGGVNNYENNNSNATLVDVFAPTHSLRVGDMGNGRGVRYPTHFNEDILTALSTPIETTGVVLSHHTAEPLFGEGLLRPRDEVLQNNEVERGISATLNIEEDGLLKPEAVVSDRTEVISGSSPHKDAISRTSPRIGIDGITEDETEDNHIIINTEAHSLHTDRNVGQRIVLHGALQTGQTLADADFTTSDFSRQSNGSPISAVLRFSHTNPFRPYGGSYILESKSYAGVFDDTGWGRNSLGNSHKTSNPYQHSTGYNTTTTRNNNIDSFVRFLVRPIRLLDKQHVELFRMNNALHTSSPQYDLNYLYATSGGKYGLFNYEVVTGKGHSTYIGGTDGANGNGPYYPVFVFDETSSLETPLSFGPKLPGTEVSGFDKTNLESTVSRLIISENTLQHHRSDAARRRQEDDTDDEDKRMDYNVKPRFSQSLHPKGHKGDVTYNTSDHTGDAS